MSEQETRLLPWQTIRYLIGPLGVVNGDATVSEGDLGLVIGPAPDEGWYLTEPAAHPGQICPVALDMIEAVS